MAKAWTVGYEGHTPESLGALLRSAGVQHVVDVRRLPASRKPGFSKRRLEAWLADDGITYTHRPGLGVDNEVRHRYRQSGDFERLATWYRDHLASQGPELAALLQDIERMRTCLLCFESDHDACHRSVLVERLTAAGVEAFHL